MKTSLIMLTYNELEGATALINRIPFDKVDEIFVVDDGSTDGTIDFLRNRGIKVIIQKLKGRGEAFKLGFKEAAHDNLIFFSLDGNENPDDIPKFKQYFEQSCDLVIASRMRKDSRNEEDDNFFKPRKWANNCFNLFINVVWNKDLGNNFITDSINGLRGITRAAWEKMRPDAGGYTIEYQTTIRAMKLGLKIREFSTYEFNRIGGESYAKSIPTGISFLKLLFNELLIGLKF